MRTPILLALLSCLPLACSDETTAESADPVPTENAEPTGPSEEGTDAGSEPGALPDLGPGPSYGEQNAALFMEIAATPPEEDAPFYMVNLVKYREMAVYADGRETNLTGREADAMYAPLEFLNAIGARIVYVGEVEQQLLGSPPTWDQVAIVRYPSRAKFLEMISDPDFQARSEHKDAGLERSTVMMAERMPLPLPEGFTPAEPVYPASADDSPFEMIHVMKYHDVAQYPPDSDEPERSGQEAVQLYSDNAGEVATPLGVYPRLWLQVKGVLIGDGRPWDEVRINQFPSHATFDALTSDADWMSGTHHRSAGLQDTYALQTLKTIDQIDAAEREP